MTDRTVVLLGGTATAGTALEAALQRHGWDTTIRHLPERSDLFDVLTRSIVHALVIRHESLDTDPENVVRGVRGLYPDLPIVVWGAHGTVESEDIDARVVGADIADRSEVAEVIVAATGDGTNTDAARPPSRMETLMLSMFDRFPAHLYAKDHDARHVVTSRFASYPTEYVGRTDPELAEFPEEASRAAHLDDRRVIDEGDPVIWLEEHASHVAEHVITSKVPWYDADGEIVGLVGLTADYTDRKEREQEARRRLELLSTVALVAAHELRNELQVASGRLELADEDDGHLAMVDASHRRLSNVVDKVVELASQETPTTEPTRLWLSTLSREVWDTLESSSGTLTVADEVEFVADRESTGLFLQILFKNAVQHGGPDVTVTVGASEDCLYIADDGDGIDVEPMERVFDAGYATKSETTGFGLYVARSIAEEQGWTLSLGESADGGARIDVHGIEILA